MTKSQVINYAKRKGICFDGNKRWLNNMVGYGYECTLPTGGFIQADTLEGLYNLIKNYQMMFENKRR